MGVIMRLSKAAELMGVSVRTVRQFIENGTLKGFKLGKKGVRYSFVSTRSVEEFLKGGQKC